VNAVTKSINEAIDLGENRQKVKEIRKSFVNAPNEFILDYRMLIKEGPLKKVCRKTVKPRAFFLFTDVLVYASSVSPGISSKYVYHQELDLSHLRLEDIADSEPSESFKMITPLKSFILIAANKIEKVEWMLAIANAIKDWKRKRFRLTGRKTMWLEEAPVWIPDSQAGKCSGCGDRFSLVKRRHHCRYCGNIFCGNCTNKKLRLPNLGSDRVRVCGKCFSDNSLKSVWKNELRSVRKTMTETEKKRI